MLMFRTVSPWTLVSLLALLSVWCSGARVKPGSKGVTRGPRGVDGPRGRVQLSNGMQCKWVTKNVSDVVKMMVKCENPQARIDGGVTDIRCEYRAKPNSCPGYQDNTKGYYKQVTRALKKLQGKVCRDERALLKAGMCKRAPEEAHFKLNFGTSVVAAQSAADTLKPRVKPTPTSKTTRTTTKDSNKDSTRTTTKNSNKDSTRSTTRGVRRFDSTGPGGTPADCKEHSQVAQEYCSGSWASVCAFFFSMVQNDDC